MSSWKGLHIAATHTRTHILTAFLINFIAGYRTLHLAFVFSLVYP